MLYMNDLMARIFRTHLGRRVLARLNVQNCDEIGLLYLRIIPRSLASVFSLHREVDKSCNVCKLLIDSISGTNKSEMKHFAVAAM